MRQGKIRYGPAAVDIDRSTSPVFFRLLVGLALIGVVLFGGGTLLLAADQIGLL
jgi:hypothetical protein